MTLRSALPLLPVALLLGAVACSTGNGGGGGGGGDPCPATCDKIAAAKCPKDKPATCLDDCHKTTAQGASLGCSAEFNAYLGCADQQGFVCDASGQANLADKSTCKAQLDAVQACAKAHADAGPPPDAASD